MPLARCGRPRVMRTGIDPVSPPFERGRHHPPTASRANPLTGNSAPRPTYHPSRGPHPSVPIRGLAGSFDVPRGHPQHPTATPSRPAPKGYQSSDGSHAANGARYVATGRSAGMFRLSLRRPKQAQGSPSNPHRGEYGHSGVSPPSPVPPVLRDRTRSLPSRTIARPNCRGHSHRAGSQLPALAPPPHQRGMCR